MSELYTSQNDREHIHLDLLASVSVLAILGLLAATGGADAFETDNRPTVWVELGGQLERVDGGATPFTTSLDSSIVGAGMISPSEFQRSPRYSIGGEARAIFEPAQSNWVFIASVKYGRSNRTAMLHSQQAPLTTPVSLFGRHSTKVGQPNYEHLSTEQSESHSVVDFSVGKDVGLGIFGPHEESTLSAGIRFAQFSASGQTALNAAPDFHFEPFQLTFFGQHITIPVGYYHKVAADWSYSRDFRGVGPSLSWASSISLTGELKEHSFNFDWGVNGALLFGRQKTSVRHQTNGAYRYPIGLAGYASPTYHRTVDQTRSKAAAVPEVGGFAGLSLRFPAAKVQLGYKADVYFGAVDGGIDVRKTFNRTFFGPFATISIGLP